MSVNALPSASVVGVTATEMDCLSVTFVSEFPATSVTAVQARTRRFDCVASIHVSETAAPVLADAVHCTLEPEPAAVIVVAVPAAAHEGEAPTADVPD